MALQGIELGTIVEITGLNPEEVSKLKNDEA